MLVAIIDLGINNLTSVQRAFSEPLRSTDSLAIIEKESKIGQPDLIVLPGLGKFGTGMAALWERNLVEKIKSWNGDGTKIVGICLGMQLLGTSSEESSEVQGLDLIPSTVKKLPATLSERIPHTGWAETNVTLKSQPFSALSTQGDFYFVHSYHLIPNEDLDVLTRTPFGEYSFVSSIYSNNVLGFQFHPEKSGKKGKKLISEIIDWSRVED